MATKKKPVAKATKNTKVSAPAKKAAPKKTVAVKGAKKPAAVVAKKPTAVKAAPTKSSKKVVTVKKAAPAKKAVPAKKAAPVAKAVVKKVAKPASNVKAKGAVKKAATVKKAAPAKKIQAKSSKTVSNKTNKTIPAKSTPAKKVVPAKKAAVPAKPAPAKKVAAKPAVHAKKAPEPVKKAVPQKAAPAAKAEPAKKAAPVAAKPEPAKKAAPVAVPVAAAPPAKPPKKAKAPKQKIIIAPTTRANAKPIVPSNVPSPSARPAITRSAIREEKKTNVIIAHRRLENKSKQADESKTMINYQPEFTRSILDQPSENQGPVYRYSDEELNEFKEIITSRIDAAKKELTYLQGLITRKDEAGTEDTENRYMNMEDGSGAMEREQLAQLASRQIQFVNHLEKALMRIENKTYGICRVTGKLIDKARLRAVPHATLSIEAKKTMTK